MEKEPKAQSLAARADDDASAAAPIRIKHPPRTFGEKMVDIGIYPIINNLGVFVISVGATYLTNKGGIKNAKGEYIYGKFGKWFQDRGEHLKNFFKKNGLNEEQADMSKMVFFSFADGTALAPFIKLLEDRRERIARWIDKKAGTTPEDDTAYREEPKQTWGSVIGGRLITAPIVVTAATILEKAGLNRVMFHEPGKKFGEYIASKPALAKHFKGMDIPELGKVGVFEAVYTSICTAGVYVISRFLAKKSEKELDEDQIAEQTAKILSEHKETPPNSEAPATKSFANEGMKRRKNSINMPAANFVERAAEAPQAAMQL